MKFENRIVFVGIADTIHIQLTTTTFNEVVPVNQAKKLINHQNYHAQLAFYLDLLKKLK